MHRTLPRPGALLAGLVVLLAAGLAPYARAQLCSPEPRPLVVLLNSTVRLQMASKKPIRTVTNPKEGVLSIRTVERDPTTIILIGTAPGITRLELEDADGVKEVKEVVVHADVEYLTAQVRRAVPLSQISVIPNGTNTVILAGYVHRAEDISVAQAVAQSVGFSVINALRLNGVQQVQLDVVVALVRRSKGRNFGFNFLVSGKHPIFGSDVGNLIPFGGSPIGVGSNLLGPNGAVQSPPGQTNLFGGIINNHFAFLGFLQALENEGVVKLLAQPRLVTLSGNPASFLNGGEQAVPVPAGLGQVGVQFEEFGTRLNFLPIVLGNGRIHLEVEPEVSVLDATAGVSIAGATVAGRATQRIHTTVEMETGQTFVIGGLIQKTVNSADTKVPVLGQLPFVGTLFSTKTATEDEDELVVMVTPHLVDAQSADQVVKVLPGQETRSPDDFELFLEGILEAPRGPRAVFQGNRYVPAHLNGPTANLFPCAGLGDGYKNTAPPLGGKSLGRPCCTGGCSAPAAPASNLSPADYTPPGNGPAGSLPPANPPPANGPANPPANDTTNQVSIEVKAGDPGVTGAAAVAPAAPTGPEPQGGALMATTPAPMKAADAMPPGPQSTPEGPAKEGSEQP
jgi:pilus assembly protein CpaC